MNWLTMNRWQTLAMLLFWCELGMRTAAAESGAGFNSITLERSGCLGYCPVYSVRVNGDGEVTFVGRQHVATIGERKATIERSDTELLALAIAKANLSTFKPSYGPDVGGCTDYSTDAPGIVIRLEAQGAATTIHFDRGCEGPPELSRLVWLADTIDVVANTRQWFGDCPPAVPASLARIPTEGEAVKRAEGIFTERFPQSAIRDAQPYHATLLGGVWHISGSMPPGALGGILEADFCQADGKFVRVARSQ